MLVRPGAEVSMSPQVESVGTSEFVVASGPSHEEAGAAVVAADSSPDAEFVEVDGLSQEFMMASYFS